MEKSKLVFVILLVGISFSCSRPSSQNTSSAPTSSQIQPGQPRHSVDVVKATSQVPPVKAGGEVDAVVQLTIDNGYHVNANPPTFPYLKATELQIPQSPVVSVSFIVYPNPLTKSFPFAEKPLAVYEGVTDIKARLKVDKGATVGSHNIPTRVQVQACDDQVCYAPGTLEVTIPLIVK